MANAQCMFPEAYEICQQFTLTEDQMNEIVNRLSGEIEMGLSNETHKRSTVKCFITHVQKLPTGKERGKFLAMDLGGSKFCIYLVEIKSATDVQIQSKCYTMSDSLKSGTGKQLFEFLANSLSEFCIQQNVVKANLKLTFIFSFPCEHTDINKAVLVNWTKGYQCSGVVGKNVLKLLQKAIDEKEDLKVRVVALLSDTTGTLMSCAHTKCNCLIGLIVGSSCNACYVEKTSNTKMFEGDQEGAKKNMIVNCEWSSFGDNGEIEFARNSYDKAMDIQTPNPMVNTFEKLIAGSYMGEIVRLIVVDLMEQGVLFKGQSSQLIREPWKFEFRLITQIASDPEDDCRNAASAMDQLGIRTKNKNDLACLRYICDSVMARSAKLVACGLVCLIRKMNVTDLSVGVDGSIYRFHPRYNQMLDENMKLLLKCATKFELILPENGASRGAALVGANSCKSS